LIKAGAGTLVLSGSNTFSGSTSIAGGTLQVGNGADSTFAGAISGGIPQLANPNLAAGRIILNNDQPFGGQGNPSDTTAVISANGAPGFSLGSAAPAQPPMPNSGASYVGRTDVSGATSSYGYAPAGQGHLSAQPQAGNPGASPQPGSGRGGRGKVDDDQQQELAEYQQTLLMTQRDQRQAQPGEDAESKQRNREQLAKLVDQFNRLNGEQRYEEAEVIAKRAQELAPHEMVTQVMISKSAILVKRDSEKGIKERKDDGFANAMIDVDQAALLVDGSRSMAAIAAPTAPTGLVSLDFELPTDKNLYEVFRFTTPRGEAELTARSVSNSTLTKLELLAGIAAASLMIWAAFWLVRGGILVWFRRPLGAILLAVAGLAALCGGVLPFIGLIALLAGIVLLVAHYWRRRTAAV
jgi:autotransporter-associated beta strand protein